MVCVILLEMLQNFLEKNFNFNRKWQYKSVCFNWRWRPRISEDIIKALGEPYIKSRSKYFRNNSGLGLGTFLGKTLLERKSAIISFENNSSLKGAKVKIKWRINDLSISV